MAQEKAVVIGTQEASRPASGYWTSAGGWLVLFLILYGVVLAVFFAPATSEPDDNGYYAQGSLLAQTGSTSLRSRSDAQYIGMHWLITPSGEYVSRYPPGIAVLVAAVYATLGYKASIMLNPALAILSLAGFYLLARHLVPAAWALVATILLATNPTFFHHALACGSHMAVLFAVVWGLYWLLRWSESSRVWHVFAAGLVLGCIPSVRYADAVMGLGTIVFLLAHWRRFARIWEHYILAAAGAAIPIVPLLLHNHRLMGSFWKTGYWLTNEQTGFTWAYFKSHAIDYVQQVQGGGVGLMFALGVVGMALMCCLRPWRRLGALLILFTVPILLVYMAYYWAPQGNSQMTMRFLLPSFPAYVLAGTWAAFELTRRYPRAAQVAVTTSLLAVHLLWGVADGLEQGQRLKYQRDVLSRVSDALSHVAGADDVVVADNQVLQHLDFVRQWKLADESVVRGGGMMGGRFADGQRDPDAPSPGQAEKQRLRRELYTGTTAERQDKFEDDILNWAGRGRVLIVDAPEAVEQRMGGRMRGSIQILSRIKLPQAPTQPVREGLGGAVVAGRMNRPPGDRPGAADRSARLQGWRGFAGGQGAPGLPGGPGMPGRMGGGGMMGRNYGEELVIAEWTPRQ